MRAHSSRRERRRPWWLLLSGLLLSVALGCGDSSPTSSPDGGNGTDAAGSSNGDSGSSGGSDAGDDGSVLPPGDLVVSAPGVLATAENGLAATFTVALSAPPVADVTVPIGTSDAGEALASPTSLVFDTTNWSAPQTVTVTGVDDAIQDGPQAFTVTIGPASSSDTRYAGDRAADLSGTNADDDTPGFLITGLVGFPTEAGGTATFTVALTKAPSASVAIPVSSSDSTEGTVSPTGLVFTTANWNVPKMVTVTGVDDSVIDGSVSYAIVLGAATSSDVGYQGLDPTDVSLHTVDDDSAGYVVSPASGPLVDSTGSSATFTVALSAQPSSSVSVPVSSSVPSVAGVAPSSLVFTTGNWNVPQTLTVTAAKIDDVDDSDAAFDVVLGTPTTTDPWFAALDPRHVALTVADDDVAGIRLGGATLGSPACGSVGPASLVTWEVGRSDSFTVRLCSRPTSNVTVTLASTDPGEAIPTPTMLTFTAVDWNVPQTVQVNGIDDSMSDGDQPFSISVTPSSSDSAYGGLVALSVPGTNLDRAEVAHGLPATLNVPTCTGTGAASCTFGCGIAAGNGTPCGARGTSTGPTDMDTATGYGYFGLGDSGSPQPSLTWDLGAELSVVRIDAICPGFPNASYPGVAHTVYARRLATDAWTTIGTIPAGSSGASLSTSGIYRELMVTTAAYGIWGLPGWNLYCTDLRVVALP